MQRDLKRKPGNSGPKMRGYLQVSGWYAEERERVSD